MEKDRKKWGVSKENICEHNVSYLLSLLTWEKEKNHKPFQARPQKKSFCGRETRRPVEKPVPGNRYQNLTDSRFSCLPVFGNWCVCSVPNSLYGWTLHCHLPSDQVQDNLHSQSCQKDHHDLLDFRHHLLLALVLPHQPQVFVRSRHWGGKLKLLIHWISTFNLISPLWCTGILLHLSLKEGLNGIFGHVFHRYHALLLHSLADIRGVVYVDRTDPAF